MPQNFQKFWDNPDYFWPCLPPKAQTYQAVRLCGRSLVECCRSWTALSSDSTFDAELIRRGIIRGWYRALLRETGETNPYGMTLRFNAETFKSHTSGLKGTGTWDNYSKELHLPSAKTLKKVKEKLKRPSEPELCAALWIGLDMSVDIRGPAPHLIRAGLAHETRAFERALGLLVPAAETIGSWELLGPEINLRHSVRLETLGALILLLRFAHTQGNREKTSQFALCLLEALSILGLELHERGIADTVFGLCCSRIFPLAGLSNLTPPAIAQLAAILNRLPWQNLHVHKFKPLEWSVRLAGMRGFLDEREQRVFAAALAKLQSRT